MKGRTLRNLALSALVAFAPAALADGSGEINDDTLNINYTTEAYVMANQVGYQSEGAVVVCETGTPTCDVYTLTVNLSDGLREQAKNGYVDFIVESTGDFDLHVYDSSGALVSKSENDGNELLTLDLEQLPNGSYTLWLIPYLAASDSATLDITVAGVDGKNALQSALGGALPVSLLVPFVLLAALRRRKD